MTLECVNVEVDIAEHLEHFGWQLGVGRHVHPLIAQQDSAFLELRLCIFVCHRWTAAESGVRGGVG